MSPHMCVCVSVKLLTSTQVLTTTRSQYSIVCRDVTLRRNKQMFERRPTKLTIRVSRETYDRLCDLAVMSGVPVATIVSDVVTLCCQTGKKEVISYEL